MALRKVYKKLTQDQKQRGVVFSSTLSEFRTEQKNDDIYEILEDDPNKENFIRNYLDDGFFDGCKWKYNIIRQ